MDIVVHQSLAEINSHAWNTLLKSNNPFMRHEFLSGLEESGCVTPEQGWEPCHIAIYGDATHEHLLGAMPCYIKQHSYGEYIFDWAWADAYRRHGIHYYPKLSNAIPFTPATGERWLIDPAAKHNEVLNALIKQSHALLNERQLSSMHCLFMASEQCQQLRQHGFLERHSTQFHWHNKGYQSFDDFLSLMSSKKRKNIKRERRRVQESGIHFKWLSGEQLSLDAAQTMHRFYTRTIQYYGAQAYLNRAFFNYLSTSFKQQTLFLFAYYEDQIIAGGLYFKSDDTLYGRYWGALNNFHSVHFETCYYQAIEWAIKHGYQRFEAGAQGEHKLARGLEPNTTYSAHWIQHPEFSTAIAHFIEQEQQHIGDYAQTMQAHSPFKHEL